MWFEVTMVLISVDTEGKTVTVTLGVKLGSVYVSAYAKHLYRAVSTCH